MSYWIVSYFLIVLLSKTNLAQDIQHMQVCIAQTTCRSCMEASNRCGWCSDWEYSNFTIGKPRCNIPERLIVFGCPLFAIKEATTGSVELLQDENFQDVIIDQIPVQLKPQKVRIKLRPLSEEILRIQYRPAKNYPLDLYYLMDLTWSMQDDKETLVGLGWNMAHTLGTFTNNFRLGFGSYADKPLMPYIFPGYEDNPCQAEHATCSPLYSFRHHMTLSGDVQEFIKKVNASDVTGNVDNLEGGLDGVVQAVVCGEQVGWRHQARKLMLVATDGSLHFAGDGKLGGVVHRQDFMCYLNSDGEYSMATKFDYPSLAEISRLLQFHKVNLIFAIGEDHREEYENIAELLKEKARVATLTGNSSNILEIVEQAYHEIVSKVILRDNSTESFNVEYFSNCGVQDSPQMPISECNGLLEGHVYDFDVKFSLKECPTNESLWRQIIVIDDALASEASEVIVEVELQCGCDCGTAINSKCINGINECGICKCDFGWSGETCNCNENSWTGNKQQCIYPGETEICSGRGECICGECSCDLGYNGLFCECSPCDKIDDVECSGRGSCDCGRCSCSTGWKGEGCQCPSDDNLCIPPGDNEVCAGHGYCDCGQCRCNETAPDGLLYRGTYCEATAGAGGSGFCSFFVSCVNATIEEPTKARDLCHTNFSIFRTQRVSTLDSASDRYCFIRKVKDTTICTIPYIYEFNKDNTVTLNIGDKTCYTPMPAAFFPGIIFGAIVLFGIIALLIWKGWTIMKDKREYTKFEKERQQTIYSLNENPLYRPAISHFRVPSMIKED